MKKREEREEGKGVKVGTTEGCGTPSRSRNDN